MPEKSTRAFGYSASFYLNKPLRRALLAASLTPRLGWPRKGGEVLVWGRKPVSRRGMQIARSSGAAVVTVEDGFLRSLRTGRQGEPPRSLVIDRKGIYFETSAPNDLRDILRAGPVLSDDQRKVALAGIACLRDTHLSKYNAFTLEPPELPDPFVLVVDQTYEDASIAGAGANEDTFAQMLQAALDEHPDAKIVIKTHPETRAGQRRGYFSAANVSDRVLLLDAPVSPWHVMERARAVYCVSSQIGMEAVFAGHRPVVFGNAYYCGMDLTEDRHPQVEPLGHRSAAQLFHAVYHDYSRWVDPVAGEATDFVATARHLSAAADFGRNNSGFKVFVGMRLWKRGFLRRYFQQDGPAPVFLDDPVKAARLAGEKSGTVYVWSGKETPALAQACRAAGVPLVRVEDGFLRSSGLGAALVEPVSLALDDLGIYYDPTRESRLETIISQNADLPIQKRIRARELVERINALGLSKYNLSGGNLPKLPQDRHLVLVPGQVEDDQSILKGCTDVRTNLGLLRAARERFPDSFIIFKPHPDVMAGLRDGGAAIDSFADAADLVVEQADIALLLGQVDCVATMTSLTGFEALLRGKQVVCFGAPFYAGWNLTEDLGQVPERRNATVSLEGLVHAALVDYPTYWDPSGKGAAGRGVCAVETILTRFATGTVNTRGAGGIRLLAKLQGLFASYAHLWR
ncbi:capsular polysaccharide biosynthesis protein [Neptunicoccus cionae]|uniref:Capsular polysaccharide biosynthesis protein n=1 Tax=Neptunicoccus cionae TaxID=2035344 RepID=A0A916VQY9_9RHOB|nr:capsular polysaccharide biosynthesis protein [Amylibacter cionae]GGA23566.1 capsular polysaccharide biosynthesis protein [Amylibacter cionae]